MEALLKGQVAIVTGAGSGMGRATAIKFASEGADVACVDMNKAGAEATAKEIEKLGRTALVCECNITVKDQVVKTVADVMAKFGKIDIMSNTAGYGGKSTDMMNECIENVTEEVFDQIVAINLKGAFMFTQAVSPIMKAAKSGKIVNFSSIGAISPQGPSSHYSAAKAGILGMTYDNAREFGAYGIRVNAIMPGSCQTNFFKDLTCTMSDEEKAGLFAAIAQSCPLGRMGLPEDMANAALFLVSDMSAYITGTVLQVTGGSPLSAAPRRD